MKWKEKINWRRDVDFRILSHVCETGLAFVMVSHKRYVVVCVCVHVHIYVCMGWNTLATGNHQQNKSVERWTVRAMCASGCGNNNATGTLVHMHFNLCVCASNTYRLFSPSTECIWTKCCEYISIVVFECGNMLVVADSNDFFVRQSLSTV